VTNQHLPPDTADGENTRVKEGGAFIELDRVYKIHEAGETGVAALGGVTLQIARRGFAAIVGPSGAGKSTILNLIGAVERPTAGVVSVGGVDLSQLDSAQLTEYRRRTVGFVWQGAAQNLVPYLTAAQNVELPLILAGRSPAEKRRRAVAELLELFGLGGRANHLPAALSGGEQQRIALAVALANRPPVLLADEPTAEIDTEAAREVVGALRRSCDELGATVVLATHDPVAAGRADLTYRLLDGRIRVPAGRARLDNDRRLVLPATVFQVLGSAESDIELEIEGAEIRLRCTQDATKSHAGSPAADTSQPRTLGRPAKMTARPPQTSPVANLPGRERNEFLLRAERLHRSYGRGDTKTLALQDVSVRLTPGDFVVVAGPSGSGKSTLLGLLGGFEAPDQGRVWWEGRDISTLAAKRLARCRATMLGVVFQALGLLPTLTARENIALPLIVSGLNSRSAARAADDWLERLGLGQRVEHRVNELSLGQQQRVAVARALAPEPVIVLADEPTAEMDHAAAAGVLDVLQEVAFRRGGVILASHDEAALHRSTHVIELRDGRLSGERTAN
jgi:ABC-type lipoprotein export system ATPase subunit